MRAYVVNKVAQTSASWLSGGLSQRQITLQATPSLGQPRPISRLGRAGTQATPAVVWFPHGCAPPRAPPGSSPAENTPERAA